MNDMHRLLSQASFQILGVLLTSSISRDLLQGVLQDWGECATQELEFENF